MPAQVMEGRGALAHPGPGLAAAALPWGALLVAFSPVLAELARDLALGFKHRYLGLLALLLAVALVRAPRDALVRPRLVPGALALALGLALELAGLAAGASIVARLGLPLAALGLGLLRGAPPALPLALAFWLVPLPNAALELASPGLETALGRLAAAALRPLGLPIECVGLTLVGPGGAHLDLRAENGGALLAHCLAGVGWFTAACAGAGLRAAAGRAALGAALALPLQPLALALAAAFVAAGQSELARLWLSAASPLLASALLLWGARCATRRRAPESAV